MTHSNLLRALVAFLGLSCLVWAQTETGQIAGAVTDPTGATVPNAAVTVVNAANGATRTTTASGAGDFTIANLLPGDYDLTVQVSGFNTFKQRVTVQVGSRVGVDVK